MTFQVPGNLVANSISYQLTDDIEIKGGRRSVATYSDLFTIPNSRLKQGMAAYVIDEDKTYILYADPTMGIIIEGDWQPEEFNVDPITNSDINLLF